jgi:23S rRNA (cytosine1962-C5)-methyltransferase
VDLSKKSLQRGEANFLANHQSLDGHRFFADDTLTVLPRLYRKQETFDVIILDPPTFSRGEKGRAFRVEHDLPSLLEQCLELLTPKGHLLVSTNCSKLTVRDLEHMGKNALKVAQRQAVFHQTPALPDLPYGAATTLWLHLK